MSAEVVQPLVTYRQLKNGPVSASAEFNPKTGGTRFWARIGDTDRVWFRTIWFDGEYDNETAAAYWQQHREQFNEVSHSVLVQFRPKLPDAA